MSLGVHFALTEVDEDRLLAAESDEDVMAIVEEIEESYPAESKCDTDKAWDPIHRSLTDGRLEYANGTFPLNAAILGGDQLIDELDYTVTYLSATQVPVVAEALDAIEEDWFRARYFAIDDPEYVTEIGEEDYDYAWDGFQDVRDFFAATAKSGRAVIFTVDA